ncbi:Enoyl-CoA hydratase/isomerase [Desulfatibacillum aliphaticivorans]|uniref:Enoyl-CoA hydratase/isomerase n=1 Tax=Desulfatibacillum aliphaticivorans TaxID=218208 RepID=B8FHU7_DESAL|nr:crotonase/enoyl-CoA hydratase family protein [Desulfatibacillum aliphaticivorans]ACL02514.1 Enoyl-CoA hydratase/isomerase [Desulfatibacillum aliphaticivorans]
MKFKDILFETQGRVAILTLNMPETRNVITNANTIQEIEEVCRMINNDIDVRVLIITGADPAFSAGGNVKEMAKKEGMFAGSPSKLMEGYRKNVQRIPMAIHGLEVPTIAAVNGPAIGAGCDLALMCDMRVASTKAKFGETFLNVGIIPGDGGAYFLPRAVGMAKACEITFTGDIIDGQSAMDMGMVNYVVEHDQLMEKARELADKIACKPPEALRMAKRLLYMGQYLTLPHLLEQSAAFQALCHNTNDHMEALNAMFEKRKPDFKGE